MRGQAAETFIHLLPAGPRQLLQRCGQVRRHRDGALIYARGNRERSLCVVEAGQVSLSNCGPDGRRAVTAILEPGDSFGEFTLLADAPRFYDFHAIGDTRIRVINEALFTRLMGESAPLREGLMRMLAQRLLMAVEMLDDIRTLPLPARLAKWLLRHHAAAAARSSGATDIDITQEALAEQLGVSRVALGFALKSFKRSGWVTTGYGRVCVTDVPAMQRWLAQHHGVS